MNLFFSKEEGAPLFNCEIVNYVVPKLKFERVIFELNFLCIYTKQ